MNDKKRLGAAVLGGYVLGRTKKGGAALRVAMWLNGTDTGSLTRKGIQQLRTSPQVNQVVTQFGQPLVAAARGAAVAAVESRLSRMAEGLNERTTKMLPNVKDLGDGLPGSADDQPEEAKAEEAGAEEAGAEEDEAEEAGAEEDEAEEEDEEEEEAESARERRPSRHGRRDDATGGRRSDVRGASTRRSQSSSRSAEGARS